MQLEFVNYLLENIDAPTEGQHIPHPEDGLFESSAEALRNVEALREAIGKDGVVSIKWDGGIALFFGYTGAGKFFISDKYMYPAGYYAKSPEEWVHYDTQVKSSKRARPDLYAKIAEIWNGLHLDCGKNPGVYKGDLMAVGPEMQPQGNAFVFRPTTVTYTVPVNSPIGQLMSGKKGLVVVHTKDNAPWDGKTGLTNAGDVAVMGANAGANLKLNADPDPMHKVEAIIKQYGGEADSFLNGLNKTVRGKIRTYFNKKITGQTTDDILTWMATTKSSLTESASFPQYMEQNIRGYECLRLVWNAIYQFKLQLAAQLEPQVTGFSQSVGNNPGGEGFVVKTSAGLIKLVNRGAGGFGQAHFNR
jgi:hypothetical protein